MLVLFRCDYIRNNRAGANHTNTAHKTSIVSLLKYFFRKLEISCWLGIFRRPKFTLLFSHGNAEDVGVNKAFCEWLSEQLSVDIVTYDYSGYGMGTGEPSEKNLYADCTAVYKWMKNTLNLRTDNIILYGKSLGTAPTVDLATRFPAIGVILVCPLASGARVVFPKVKNSLLDRVFCPTILKIDKITSPIFIMHGTNDEVINVCNGQDLYEACRPQHPLPPVWVEGKRPTPIVVERIS